MENRIINDNKRLLKMFKQFGSIKEPPPLIDADWKMSILNEIYSMGETNLSAEEEMAMFPEPRILRFGFLRTAEYAEYAGVPREKDSLLGVSEAISCTFDFIIADYSVKKNVYDMMLDPEYMPYSLSFESQLFHVLGLIHFYHMFARKVSRACLMQMDRAMTVLIIAVLVTAANIHFTEFRKKIYSVKGVNARRKLGDNLHQLIAEEYYKLPTDQRRESLRVIHKLIIQNIELIARRSKSVSDLINNANGISYSRVRKVLIAEGQWPPKK